MFDAMVNVWKAAGSILNFLKTFKGWLFAMLTAVIWFALDAIQVAAENVLTGLVTLACPKAGLDQIADDLQVGVVGELFDHIHFFIGLGEIHDALECFAAVGLGIVSYKVGMRLAPWIG